MSIQLEIVEAQALKISWDCTPRRLMADSAAGKGTEMDSNTSNSVKNVLQILAIFCMIVIWSTILHKGYAGISALARKHSGEEFWLALARYLMQNLAG